MPGTDVVFGLETTARPIEEVVRTVVLYLASIHLVV